jgi:hypothetical protein
MSINAVLPMLKGMAGVLTRGPSDWIDVAATTRTRRVTKR